MSINVFSQENQCSCTFDGSKLTLSEEEWKERLNWAEFLVLRKDATELAYANEYYNNDAEGIYVCAGCELPLYSSKAKYDAGTGWPSFFQPINALNVSYKQTDTRIAVSCSRCSGHLGHVFGDGPEPTHLRYCMNSTALKFIEAEQKQ